MDRKRSDAAHKGGGPVVGTVNFGKRWGGRGEARTLGGGRIKIKNLSGA